MRLLKTLASLMCLGVALVISYLVYRKITIPVESPLSPMEIKIRNHHRYWAQIANTTNSCAPQSVFGFGGKTPSNMYAEMPQQLRQIPTQDIDPDVVRTVQKYLAPGLARLSNFNQMESEVAAKIALSIGLAIITVGSSELADAADGADAAIALADIADVADVADIADITDITEMASVADAIDTAGGLEAVIGQMPGKGILGISATVKYFKEKSRIPGIRHIVEYRTERTRKALEGRYGGPFEKIKLDLPIACSQ